MSGYNGGFFMERIRTAQRLGRLLKEEGIQNSTMVAVYWVDRTDRDEYWDHNDRETLKFIKSKVEIDKIEDASAFASAFINGKDNIEAVYNYLLNFYTDEELKKYYQSNFYMFSFSLASVQKIEEYLNSLELNHDQIKTVLLATINLGLDECKVRNDLVLKLFNNDKEFLVFLAAERSLYYPYGYIDVPEALEFLVQEIGIEKARQFLEDNKNSLYFLFYRGKEYRTQYQALFDEATEMIEQYK